MSTASELLTPLHVEDLARSAITSQEAVEAGMRSLTAADVSARVGFPVVSAGYEIPYPRCDAFRVRLFPPHRNADGKEAKYLSPLGATIRLYIPPGVREELEADRARPLYIPEGEKKTLSMRLRLGLASIGVPGVWAWKNKERESGVIEDLDELRPLLKGRLVVILFDSDTRTNPHVALAAWQFSAWLREAGARPRWAFPPLDGSGKKMGIDDLIATKGCEEARALIEKHFEPRDPAAFMVQARYEAATDEERNSPFAGSTLYEDLRRLLTKVRAELRASLAEETRVALGLSIQDRGALLAGLGGGKDGDDDALQGHALSLEDPEPWEDAVDVAEILDQVAALMRRYVVLPDHAAEASALWVAHTYTLNAAHCSPRLAIVSPAKRCGKTTLLDLLAHVALRALPSCNLSAAVVYRVMEAFHPALIVDEADTFLDTREELQGVLNAGHRIGGTVLRCEGDDHTPRKFTVFGAAAIAMIGRLPDTQGDRSILIQMRRRTRGEGIESLRFDRLEAQTLPLRRKLIRWATDNLEMLRAADPMVPEGLDDRAADNWRPLLAIADMAGGTWPTNSRKAAVELSRVRGEDEDSRSVELLKDVRTLFDEEGAEHLTTERVIECLVALPERPWADYRRGKAITGRQLAGLLKPFGVTYVKWREGGKTPRGYRLSDLSDAFSRYLPPSGSATVPHTHPANDLRQNESATPIPPVADANSRNPLVDMACGTVADPKGGWRGGNGSVAAEPVLPYHTDREDQNNRSGRVCSLDWDWREWRDDIRVMGTGKGSLYATVKDRWRELLAAGWSGLAAWRALWEEHRNGKPRAEAEAAAREWVGPPIVATDAAPANGTSSAAGTDGGNGLEGDAEAPSGHAPSSCPLPVADAIPPQVPGVRSGGGSGGGKPGGNGAHSNRDGKDGARPSGHAVQWGWPTIPEGWTSGHPLESCIGCGKSASSRDPRGVPRHPWCGERR